MNAFVILGVVQVAFSLPFMSRGEIDAAGLCTIAILNRLGQLHNAVVQKQRSPAQQTTTVLSHQSSLLTISQHLLMYDRQSDLLPVAEWFYEASQFDFKVCAHRCILLLSAFYLCAGYRKEPQQSIATS